MAAGSALAVLAVLLGLFASAYASIADLQTVITALSATGSDYTELLQVVTGANLTDALVSLASQGPITIFAPTNAALTAVLDSGCVTDAALIPPVLTSHIVTDGAYPASQVLTAKSAYTTANPNVTLAVTLQGGNVYVSVVGAPLVSGDSDSAKVTPDKVVTSTVVVHGIDDVLLPGNVYQAFATCIAAKASALASAPAPASQGVAPSSHASASAPKSSSPSSAGAPAKAPTSAPANSASINGVSLGLLGVAGVLTLLAL